MPVAAGFLADMDCALEIGEYGFEVGNHRLDALRFGAACEQFLFEVEIQWQRPREMIRERGVIVGRQILLGIRESENLFMQFQRAFDLIRSGFVGLVGYQQDLSPQKGAVLVDLQELKSLAALCNDIHSAVFIGLGHGDDLRRATDVRQVLLLGADYAEQCFLFQTLADHLLVPRFEDVQRQRGAREQDNIQRKYR